MSVGEAFVGRFDFHEAGLDGRAYVHGFGFDKAHRGDFFGLVKYVRKVVGSDALSEVREKEYGGTVAVVWGGDKNKYIDFYGYRGKKGTSVWNGNLGIFGWVVVNGVILPQKDIVHVGCEDGIGVLALESRHRRSVGGDDYAACGPEIEGLNSDWDFSSPMGRIRLADEMGKVRLADELDKARS